MTDCLSEDDDEEHHPVHLLHSIAAPVTHRAGETISRTNPEAHLAYVHHPVARDVPDGTTAISPVFQDRCSSGLMGI
ncbi:MAG: hypothetical protein Q7T80_18020 [Methanoregula sp.]|nr:hypothetical protein [Methanoregula sp.]